MFACLMILIYFVDSLYSKLNIKLKHTLNIKLKYTLNLI